jgi:hypothetical protein
MGLHTLRECLHKAGLAQARLPDYKHDLAHPLLSLLPPIFQQTQFGIPTRERREPKRHVCFGLVTTSRFGLRLRLAGPFLPLRSISESEEIHGITFPESRIQREDNPAPVSLQINGVEEAILLIAT